MNQPPQAAPQPSPATTQAPQAPQAPRAATAPQPAPAGQAPTLPALPLAFGWREGDERLLLEIDAERCAVSVGGKPLPADRVRRSGNRVRVLDSEGGVAAQVTLF